MSIGTGVLLAVVLVYVFAAGAAVLARLLRDEPDPEVRADGVIAFALPVGLILAALPGWFLSAARTLSISRVAVPLGALALAAVLAAFYKDLLALPRSRRSLVPFAVFFGLFLFYVWLRYSTPDIRQTEKPMDFAILNTILTAPTLPLGDPWMSGERFAYYHFGTFFFGLPFRVAGVAPEIAYNLLAALLGGLAGLASFGVARMRGGSRRLAVLAACLVAVTGTLDGARQFLAGRPIGGLDMWPSSRRVANTITEWPLFTLWLGDLHPHAITLPILITWAGVAGRFSGRAGLAFDALLLGSLLSANPWDLPAAALLLAAGNMMQRELKPAFWRSVLTFLVAIPVLLPFLTSPRPNFQGILFWPGGTGSAEAFLHFGGVLAVLALAIGIALVRSQERAETQLLIATLFPAVGIAIAILAGQPVFGLAWAFIFAVLFLLPRMEGTLKNGFILAAAATALVALPETLVVKDPYGDQLKRMNTVFKTYAGAYPMLAISSALLLPLALSTRRARRTIRVVLTLAFAGMLFHPLSLLIGRIRTPAKGTMDGLAWLSREYPGDRKAIEWLRANASPTATVAEASGGAYDDRSRIGTGSGRPTFLGWAGHEGVWRGEKGNPEIQSRQTDLRTIYTMPNAQGVATLLKRRGIRYVVVGPLEKKDFGEQAFPSRTAFRKVFSEDGTELYEAVLQ